MSTITIERPELQRMAQSINAKLVVDPPPVISHHIISGEEFATLSSVLPTEMPVRGSFSFPCSDEQGNFTGLEIITDESFVTGDPDPNSVLEAIRAHEITENKIFTLSAEDEKIAMDLHHQMRSRPLNQYRAVVAETRTLLNSIPAGNDQQSAIEQIITQLYPAPKLASEQIVRRAVAGYLLNK